ncbi:PLP-dependent aminotransferase family protein [Vibrio caribbeanicus]|uniref:aminotransferase-like domain-containing protein n=1 Tax=Vibrio caribbeanicus TaxID=701175 RepID=UPI0030DCC196
MAKYKQLANQFVLEIEQGRRKEGSKMPSLRQLARQYSVSMSTAVNCYQELESQGWIHASPQSGFFVTVQPLLHSIPEWVTFESKVTQIPKTVIERAARSFNQAGPLGVSSAPIDELTRLELERSFRRGVSRTGNYLEEYPDHQGSLFLRQAVTKHLARANFPFSAEQVVITEGCMAAIKLALESCTRAGDTVAISSPCFNGILELLALMERKIIEIPSNKDGIDLEQLERHLDTGLLNAAVFCTSHMNPQGITMTVAQKQKLASLANQHQVPIIEDDVYLELSHLPEPPLPAKYYDEGGYILWCSSISKTLSPSYRLGWCLPGRFIHRYKNQVGLSTYGISLPVQAAIGDFIESGSYAKHLTKQCHQLRINKKEYTDYLLQRLGDRVKISAPQGGMVLWLQVPTLDVKAFRHAVESIQLDIRLGDLFSTLNLYDDCFRVNFGYPLEGKALDALDTLVHLIIRSS